MEIGVRYCGGCNPIYERQALVKKLEQSCPGLRLVPAQAGIRYEAVLVVCGCRCRCAGVSDLAVSADRLIWLSGWEDLMAAERELEALTQPRTELSLDREAVWKLLPHRPPMLMVERVSHLLPGREAVASCSVSPELSVLRGHFPNEPMLPGVFTLEAGAQTAALLLLTTMDCGDRLPLLTGVRSASFRARLLPGDRLEVHAELLELRRELGHALFSCKVFRDAGLAARMELSLTLGQI